MSLRHRIARLLQQSRIRLPRAPLDAEVLRPGDWLQIGSRDWRVRSRRFELDRVVFRLRSAEGSDDALLEATGDPSVMWKLEQDGETIRISPELLVVFPVGVP